MPAHSLNTTIGKNIRMLREKMGITQQVLGDYLQTTREQISYYETGTRPVTTNHLSQLAALFCIDESDFYEEDEKAVDVNLAFAFRADALNVEDLKSIAVFKKIVRNYLNMQKVLAHEE